MIRLTSPPRMLSNMGASHLFAGKDIGQRQREERDNRGNQDDVEHGRAPR